MTDIELRPFQNENGTSIVSPVAKGNFNFAYLLAVWL